MFGGHPNRRARGGRQNAARAEVELVSINHSVSELTGRRPQLPTPPAVRSEVVMGELLESYTPAFEVAKFLRRRVSYFRSVPPPRGIEDTAAVTAALRTDGVTIITDFVSKAVLANLRNSLPPFEEL